MRFHDLLNTLSKLLGSEIADEGGAAAVEIDGQNVLLHQADDDLLLIRADLGEIPADLREKIVAAAMEANYLYQGTGGATLAVNPNDGHLHLQKYNWLERLDADKAIDTLSRFADTALAWKKIISDVADAPLEQTSLGDGFIQA